MAELSKNQNQKKKKKFFFKAIEIKPFNSNKMNE